MTDKDKFYYEKEQIDDQFSNWVEELIESGEFEHAINDFIMSTKMSVVLNYAILWIAGTRFNGDTKKAKQFLKDEKFSNILEFAQSYIFISYEECNDFMDYLWQEYIKEVDA